jgi:hypothetical protein
MCHMLAQADDSGGTYVIVHIVRLALGPGRVHHAVRPYDMRLPGARPEWHGACPAKPL